MSHQLGMSDAAIAICQNPENWLGSYYEVGLAFPLITMDEHTRLQVLRCLWQHPSLYGVLKDRRTFGQPWQDIDTSAPNHPLYQYV